jgi:hypothetical protein
MTARDWDDIANREFETMDTDWQADWADLRERILHES